MEVSRMRKFAIKVFKNLNSLRPDFINTYLVVNMAKTTTFGEKSLQTLGGKIWNSCPEDVKDLTSLLKFTKFIKTCYKAECSSE